MPSFSKAVNPYGQYVLTNQQIADVGEVRLDRRRAL